MMRFSDIEQFEATFSHRKIVLANSTLVRFAGDRSPGVVSVRAQLTVWVQHQSVGRWGPNEKWGRINNAADRSGFARTAGVGWGWGAPRTAPRTGLPLTCGVSRMVEKDGF
jgi:hypothetical protein